MACGINGTLVSSPGHEHAYYWWPTAWTEGRTLILERSVGWEMRIRVWREVDPAIWSESGCLEWRGNKWPRTWENKRAKERNILLAESPLRNGVRRGRCKCKEMLWHEVSCRVVDIWRGGNDLEKGTFSVTSFVVGNCNFANCRKGLQRQQKERTPRELLKDSHQLAIMRTKPRHQKATFWNRRPADSLTTVAWTAV